MDAGKFGVVLERVSVFSTSGFYHVTLGVLSILPKDLKARIFFKDCFEVARNILHFLDTLIRRHWFSSESLLTKFHLSPIPPDHSAPEHSSHSTQFRFSQNEKKMLGNFCKRFYYFSSINLYQISIQYHRSVFDS